MKTAQEIRQELEKSGFVWIRNGGKNYFEIITKELGEVIFVTDVKVNPESRALVTSEKGLDFHTDHHKANYIAWYCIEQTDEGGESILQDANKVFELLTEEEQAELRKVRLFEHKVFEDDEDTYPFVIEESGKREFYYSFWLAKENISEYQKELIRKYQKLTNETEYTKIKLHPTDILIIDNHRILHGRTAIAGSKNRFLKRLWIKSFHN
jgi:alpha-ketoglutarate-dependent taurine dioxygenase